MKKEPINLVSLQELLKGRKWEEMTKEEQLEVAQKIADLILNKVSNN